MPSFAGKRRWAPVSGLRTRPRTSERSPQETSTVASAGEASQPGSLLANSLSDPGERSGVEASASYESAVDVWL